ncbi:MAG: alcohol dehydrogenase catalytic domain-containing protein [Candidatus Dormibacteraceae bacterium]
MKAWHIDAWDGPLTLSQVPDPRPGEGEVLVGIEACGVGLTVLNCIHGDLGSDLANLPRVPGHELVGRIVETGPGVDRSRTGERVTAYFYLFCGRCRNCLVGREPLCERLAGYLGVDRDGGYAELVVLPERNAIPLPAGLDPVAATVVADAVATPVHVARRAGMAPGDRVAVVAAGGGVGIHMVQVARLWGADVVGLDRHPGKLGYLRSELGVAAVDSSDFARLLLPPGWDGRCDVVVDFLGTPDSLRWALSALREGGRLVTLTTFRGVEATLSPRDLVLRQLSVLGSRYAARHDLDLAARLVASGRVRPVIGRRVGAEGALAVHAELGEGNLLGRGALVWS